MTKDPMDGHKCERIATAFTMGEGRSCWLGKLLDPIPGYPEETHCLHIVTPAKDVVFGVNLGDMLVMAIFAQIVHEGPINQRWLDRMEELVRDVSGTT